MKLYQMSTFVSDMLNPKEKTFQADVRNNFKDLATTGNAEIDAHLYYEAYVNHMMETHGSADDVSDEDYKVISAAQKEVKEKLAALNKAASGSKKKTSKPKNAKAAPEDTPKKAAAKAEAQKKPAGANGKKKRVVTKAAASKKAGATSTRETPKDRYEKTGNIFKKDTIGHEVFRLLKSGRFTRDQLLEEVQKKHPDAKSSSVFTIISDTKNHQFNHNGIPITLQKNATSGKLKVIPRGA